MISDPQTCLKSDTSYRGVGKDGGGGGGRKVYLVLERFYRNDHLLGNKLRYVIESKGFSLSKGIMGSKFELQ